MKNLLLLTLAMVLVASCTKQETVESSSLNWNGYGKYLKTGEMNHILWAGQNINVGTVTYGLDDSANFYVTYDCSGSGWLISETHMFAGTRADMPLNKPGAPKIGRFPNSTCHEPWVSTYTYRVPLAWLPPCSNPGFVVASHCIVHSPGGQTETAWADGGHTFSDKGWGWYDTYFYNTYINPTIIIYGTTITADTMRLYHLDITNNSTELILEEYSENGLCTFDGAAFDYSSGNFFYSNYSTGELWVNPLQENGPSFSAGTLDGISASGTFYDGSYYYVDAGYNTINRVDFSDTWTIESETVLDTVPGSVTVNDLAMSPDGAYLRFMGEYNGGGNELITWDVSDHTFYSQSIAIENGAQIAYGSDGVLYTLSPVFNGSAMSVLSEIDTESDTLTIIEHDIIIVPDPFTDLARGPSI